jgi:coenzyme F420 hydrogenase subunit beta
MRPSPSLKRVLRGDLCTGCGGCVAAAPGKIAMTLTGPGWLRPLQLADLDEQEEMRIAGICPGIVLEQDAAGRPDDPMWGPVLACRTGHAIDADMRHTASSGGGLSALLSHLLETGAVDRILQIAADQADPLGNTTVFSMNSGDVVSAAGSRYAPSAPLVRLEEALVADGLTAFVGKPCDVAALRALARFDSRIDAKIRYMLSFFCAGVPARAGAVEVLKSLAVDEADLRAFRYRGEGWPGYAAATRRDGSTVRMSYADSWGGILSRHVQFRCKICPDGTGGLADIVCADAWICDERGYPLFEEQEGISLILSRTARGEALVQAAMTSGHLAAATAEVASIAATQPGQTGRKRALAARLAALAVAGRPRPRYRGFHLPTLARHNRLWLNLRAFVGTLRRLALPRH